MIKVFKLKSRFFTKFSHKNNANQNQLTNTSQMNLSNEENLIESLKSLPSLTISKSKRIHKTITINELIHSREFSYATMMLVAKNYDESEKIFSTLKRYLYNDYLGSPIYLMVIRRLGITLLKQNKSNEGILEIENVDEFSQSKEEYSNEFRFVSAMDRLKAYINFDCEKGAKYSDYLLNQKSMINLLNRNQLSELFYSTALAYFSNGSKSFEKIKIMMRKAVNYHLDPLVKATIIHNIAVVLYYEIKTHNDIVEKNKSTQNQMKNLNQMNKFYDQMDESFAENQNMDLNKRNNRVLNEEEKINQMKMMEELEKFKIDEKNPVRDKLLKNIAKREYFRQKSIEDMKLKLIKEKEIDESKKVNRNEYENSDILHDSKFQKNTKIHPIKYKYEESMNTLDDQFKKIAEHLVDYENDLDSIIPNIFLSIKLFEYSLLINTDPEKLKEIQKQLIKNISNDVNIKTFTYIHDQFREYLNLKSSDISIEKHQINNDLIILDFREIKKFDEILEKDVFFTSIRNHLSIKSVLFLAELYTEFSMEFKQQSEFWIKYCFSILKRFKNHPFNYKALCLAAAYSMDHENDYKYCLNLLEYLYKKDELRKNDIVTYNIASLLYGIILKLNPKTKGEGLEIIESAQFIKEKILVEEKMSNIFYDDFHAGIDIDPEYLKQIYDTMSKLGNPN